MMIPTSPIHPAPWTQRAIPEYRDNFHPACTQVSVGFELSSNAAGTRVFFRNIKHRYLFAIRHESDAAQEARAPNITKP